MFPELATLSCQWQALWLSQIYISCTPTVSTGSRHLSTVLCFRHKCFHFEDFQTKSIPWDSVGKNRIQISITLAFSYPCSQSHQSQGPCTTIRQTKSSLCIWRIDALSANWPDFGSPQSRCDEAHTLSHPEINCTNDVLDIKLKVCFFKICHIARSAVCVVYQRTEL